MDNVTQAILDFFRQGLQDQIDEAKAVFAAELRARLAEERHAATAEVIAELGVTAPQPNKKVVVSEPAAAQTTTVATVVVTQPPVHTKVEPGLPQQTKVKPFLVNKKALMTNATIEALGGMDADELKVVTDIVCPPKVDSSKNKSDNYYDNLLINSTLPDKKEDVGAPKVATKPKPKSNNGSFTVPADILDSDGSVKIHLLQNKKYAKYCEEKVREESDIELEDFVYICFDLDYSDAQVVAYFESGDADVFGIVREAKANPHRAAPLKGSWNKWLTGLRDNYSKHDYK